MIPACPKCGQVPEPVKPTESLFVWVIECCGLKSKPTPWFEECLRFWQDVVTMYKRTEHELPKMQTGD